jgi:hypothetical protein
MLQIAVDPFRRVGDCLYQGLFTAVEGECMYVWFPVMLVSFRRCLSDQLPKVLVLTKPMFVTL